MRFRGMIAAAWLILAPAFAPAQEEDGPPLKELAPVMLGWCKQYQETKCRAFLVAYRAAMAGYTEKHPELPRICVPDPIDGKGLTAHVIQRLESEPDLLQFAGGEAIAEIIMQDYGCKHNHE